MIWSELNLISSCHLKREVNHVQTNQSILPDVPLFIGSHFNSRQRSAPLFDVQSTTGLPFPTDRFTLTDSAQNTDRRVNLPMPNCVASPSNCGDVALLNQLDGFNIQPRISIPFDGAIDPSTVNNNTVFLIRIADTSNRLLSILKSLASTRSCGTRLPTHSL